MTYWLAGPTIVKLSFVSTQDLKVVRREINQAVMRKAHHAMTHLEASCGSVQHNSEGDDEDSCIDVHACTHAHTHFDAKSTVNATASDCA